MRFKKFVKLYISDYACAWALKRLDKFWMRIVKCTLWSETEAMRIDMLKLAWKNSWNHIKLTFLAGFSLLDFGVTVGRESRHEAVVVAGRFAASHLLFTFSNYRSTTELVSSSCTDSFVGNLLVSQSSQYCFVVVLERLTERSKSEKSKCVKGSIFEGNKNEE